MFKGGLHPSALARPAILHLKPLTIRSLFGWQGLQFRLSTARCFRVETLAGEIYEYREEGGKSLFPARARAKKG